MRGRVSDRRAAFTLLELLVVILIVGLVSAVALPTILPALARRQISEAGRILQGAIVGARDRAIHEGRASGIRLVPDPTLPATYNRLIPIEPAPDYMEGLATVRAGAIYAAAITNPAGNPQALPSLVLESAPFAANGAPNPPTNWAWNIRVGDKIQLNGGGNWYTVVGPVIELNSDDAINYGPPGVSPPLNPTGNAKVEWLILTDGRDDNGNGWTDEGFDGVDNDNVHGTDDPGEWEPEQWQGAAAGGLTSVPYVVRRRPVPTVAAREIALPTHVVIDAAHSSLPMNPMNGMIELMVNPDGTAYAAIPYGVPTMFNMSSAFYHFALLDRGDVGTGQPPQAGWAMFSVNSRSGRTVVIDEPNPANPFAAAMQGVQ